MKWSMLWDLFAHSMSLPFDHTCCLDKSELETCLRFPVRKPQSKATIGVVLSFSSSSNSLIQCCPPTPRPSTQAAHQLLQTACPESSCSCFPLLVGFFGFILTLGISASKGSSSSSCPVSTSARDSPTGSMSSPTGTASRFKVFVGHMSALLCHTRFPTVDSLSQTTARYLSHCGFFQTSLIGSHRNWEYHSRYELE